MTGMSASDLESRRSFIGASDVAAIMGLSPWQSPYDVWIAKRNGVDQSKSEAARLGNHLEISCMTLATDALGMKVHRSGLVRDVAGTKIRVNLDGYTDAGGQIIPVEAKTAGILNPFGAKDEWGEEWSDEIPDHYIVQVHAQMMAVDAPHAYVSAIIGGRGHSMFHIERNDDLCGAIVDACAPFWECVQNGTPPDGALPSLDVVSRARRTPGSVCEIDDSAVHTIVEWNRAKHAAKLAEEKADALKAIVIASLGGCEAGIGSYTDEQAVKLADALGTTPEKAHEKTALTYMQQVRRNVDMDRLKSEHPEVYRACIKESSFRVLRLGKPKKGMTINAKPADKVENGDASNG